MYDGEGTWKPVLKKDGQTRSRQDWHVEDYFTFGSKDGEMQIRSDNNLKTGMTRVMPLHHL